MSKTSQFIRKSLGSSPNSCNLFNGSIWESPLTWSTYQRYYSGRMKRYYLNAAVAKNDKGFEIQLDKKTLKTPSKQTLTVKNEALANAVAAEWCAQKTVISPSIMHLTALSNTVQDNPLRKTKDALIQAAVDSLAQDTILYRAEEDEKLMRLQRQKWDPVYRWFIDEFQVNVPLASGMLPPEIPAETYNKIREFLEANSFEAVQGFVFGVDAIKSLILTTATVMNILTPKEAVHLSRLEVEFQAAHWGTVEWHHEVELFDSIARLSAATLFFETNSHA